METLQRGAGGVYLTVNLRPKGQAELVRDGGADALKTFSDGTISMQIVRISLFKYHAADVLVSAAKFSLAYCAQLMY